MRQKGHCATSEPTLPETLSYLTNWIHDYYLIYSEEEQLFTPGVTGQSLAKGLAFGLSRSLDLRTQHNVLLVFIPGRDEL